MMTQKSSRRRHAAPTMFLLVLPIMIVIMPTAVTSFAAHCTQSRNSVHQYAAKSPRSSMSFSATSPTIDGTVSGVHVGPRMPINEDFPGLQKIYSNPDIFVIENFLQPADCHDLIQRATAKKLKRSPVAYAGWTEDFKDLVELAAKGPVAWMALIVAWLQVKDETNAGQVDLVVHALKNYVVVFVLVTALIAAFTYSRAEGLKSLRTSTSTTLDDLDDPSAGHETLCDKLPNYSTATAALLILCGTRRPCLKHRR